MSQSFIPFHKPSIGEEEIDEVVETLRSGWLTTGARTAQFEREFSEYVRVPHALAVNSCTAALHLALAALKIGPGDEVITTPLTFCATVNTILHMGAQPVLADVGLDGNIDPASIAERISAKTRAILPVHLAGLPCDMAAIWELARTRDLRVVEDAAHAIGTEYNGLPIGAAEDGQPFRSDAVAFSFYATKSLTTGEGGMVTTPSAELAEQMRILCLHGISADAWNRYSEKGKWFYTVVDCGFKYNLSDLQSAIGIHQLRRQEHFVARRSHIAKLYRSHLSELEELELPQEQRHSRHAWHLYTVRLNTDQLDANRDEIITRLKAAGIGTSVHFIPIPLHPAYSQVPGLRQELCPKALRMYPRLISLPIYPGMTDGEVERVSETLKATLRGARKTRELSFAAH